MEAVPEERRHSGKQVVRQVDCEEVSGWRRSSFWSLCHSYLPKPPEMTRRLHFFIVSQICCPSLPMTSCTLSVLLGTPCRHPLSLFSFWLLIKMMVKCLNESAPKDSSLRLQFPFLLGLFFAVNYSLELITFFFLFFVILIFIFSFNSCLLYWCHFRDCLFLLTFFRPLWRRTISYIFIIMSEKQRKPFHFPFIY